MKKHSEPLRIALICNNLVRELGTLTSLKNELEKGLGAKVKLIGSLAEIQRTFYSLYKFAPHIVFLSQLQEKCCRDIALYVKQSGGIVVVMPEEITPAKVVESLIISPLQKYDHLVDKVCLPGEVMYDFFSKTDIKKSKLSITGSPKVDVELSETGMNREAFCRRFKMDSLTKNVFIFTSFPHTGIEYFKKDECFVGSMTLVKRIQRVIRQTQVQYLKNLEKICRELDDYSVILKPHPLEDLKYYERINAPNLFIATGVSVLDCFDSIDVATHWNSTVSTSCWVRGINVFQYSPLKKHDWLLSDFTGGNPFFHDYGKMCSSIKKALKGDFKLPAAYERFRESYFRKNFYRVDGKSAQRIVKVVSSLESKTKEVNYKPTFSRALYVIGFMEKFLGVFGSRRLISLLSNYNWRYAADNYIP